MTRHHLLFDNKPLSLVYWEPLVPWCLVLVSQMQFSGATMVDQPKNALDFVVVMAREWRVYGFGELVFGAQ
jgi:hypothetical protein